MAIITLTSDWGDSDYYAAAVKGSIYSLMPDVKIVDVSHHIQPFQISQAAFILQNAYPNFPEGTVHIMGVNTEESEDEPHTVIKYKSQYFIGADSGFFSLLLEDDQPEKIILLDIAQSIDSDGYTFSSRDRFSNAAVHLARGGELEELGPSREEVSHRISLKPIQDEERIRGVIIHVDTYGNVITNISKEMLIDFTRKKKFQIQVRSAKIPRISSSYRDEPEGNPVAVFSSSNKVEVAINQGKAASLLGVSVGSPVLVELL